MACSFRTKDKVVGTMNRKQERCGFSPAAPREVLTPTTLQAKRTSGTDAEARWPAHAFGRLRALCPASHQHDTQTERPVLTQSPRLPSQQTPGTFLRDVGTWHLLAKGPQLDFAVASAPASNPPPSAWPPRQAAFVTTHWSVVLAAGQGGSQRAVDAPGKTMPCLPWKNPRKEWSERRDSKALTDGLLVQGDATRCTLRCVEMNIELHGAAASLLFLVANRSNNGFPAPAIRGQGGFASRFSSKSAF